MNKNDPHVNIANLYKLALEFYVDPNNYIEDSDGNIKILQDKGYQAEYALKTAKTIEQEVKKAEDDFKDMEDKINQYSSTDNMGDLYKSIEDIKSLIDHQKRNMKK